MKRHLLLAGILAAVVISRVPLVVFPEHPLTGDECVVGLMGKHLVEGRDLSLYFYGQHYGLALLEAAAAAAAIPIFGVTSVGVRVGMLGLLLLSMACLTLALTRIAGRGAGILGVLLVLTIPPWTLWSLQARGGYVTALLGTSAVLAGVASLQHRPARWGWAGVALAAAVTLLAKSSWLPALLPVLLLVPVQQRNARLGLGLLAGITGLCLAGHLAGIQLTRDYWQQPPVGLHLVPQNLRLLPSLLSYHFSTDLFSAGPENLPYRIAGGCWLLGLAAGIVIQLRRVATRAFCPWSHALCLSTLGSLALLLVVPLLPRYLLSVSLFLVLWLVVEFAHLPHRRIAAAGAILLVGLGVAGLVIDRCTPTDAIDESDIHALIELLDDEGIHHVYSTEALLPWMVMFYSGESIRCRWRDPEDRLPEIPRAVDRARAAGEPTAIIGLLGQLGGLGQPDAGIDVYSFPDLPFFIAPNPTPEILEAHGFELNSREGP